MDKGIARVYQFTPHISNPDLTMKFVQLAVKKKENVTMNKPRGLNEAGRLLVLAIADIVLFLNLNFFVHLGKY